MSRVLALVEGQTERTFVQAVLAPEIAYKNVYVSARVIGKPGHKGGVGSFDRARKEIVNLLRQEPGSYCTTMFDYYGMPGDWPGVADAKGQPYAEIPATIETAIGHAIALAMGESFDPLRFAPYVQMHEFEALLFSDPAEFAAAIGTASLVAQFQSIVEQCGGCEAIDDGQATAPSKRILRLVPSYAKVLHGSIAAKRIGLARMRERCPHFNQWVARLESLGTSSP